MVVLWHHHCERTLEHEPQDRRTLLHAVLDVLRGEEVGLALALDRDLAIVLEQDRTDGLRGILSTHTHTRTHRWAEYQISMMRMIRHELDVSLWYRYRHVDRAIVSTHLGKVRQRSTMIQMTAHTPSHEPSSHRSIVSVCVSVARTSV